MKQQDLVVVTVQALTTDKNENQSVTEQLAQNMAKSGEWLNNYYWVVVVVVVLWVTMIYAAPPPSLFLPLPPIPSSYIPPTPLFVQPIVQPTIIDGPIVIDEPIIPSVIGEPVIPSNILGESPIIDEPPKVERHRTVEQCRIYERHRIIARIIVSMLINPAKYTRLDTIEKLLKLEDDHVLYLVLEELIKYVVFQHDDVCKATIDAFINVREVAEAAIDALVKIGQPSIKPLIHLLDNSNSNVREAAIDALVKIGQPSIKPLNHLLYNSNSNSNVRKAAANALLKLRSPSTAPPTAPLQRDTHQNSETLTPK